MSAPRPPAESIARPQSRPHVLIISDDAGLSTFLAEGLLYGGFWTSVVASGLQALEVFRLRGFDLILVDAALGGIGALESIHRLRGTSDRATPGDPRTDAPIGVITDEVTLLLPSKRRLPDDVEVLSAPLELEEIVPRLHAIVEYWRLIRSENKPIDQ